MYNMLILILGLALYRIMNFEMYKTTGPQLGSVARCPSQTVVQVRHAQAQVCHRQSNTYQAKISSNGKILYLNCPEMDVLTH